MARLIYSAIMSLDGYTADADGRIDWAAPDEEVHAFVNDLERPVGTYLYSSSSSAAVGTGPPPSGIGRPESRHRTAAGNPCCAADSWNQRPSGECRVMPSNRVARIWVPARPMLS